MGAIVHEMEDWDEVDFYPDPPDDAARKAFSMPYRTVLCNKTVTSTEKVLIQALDSAGKSRTDNEGAPIMVVKRIQDRGLDGSLSVDAQGDPVMIDETIEVVKQVPVYGEKWVITDETQQKIVLGKYERSVRELEKKWHLSLIHI